jgi:septal ring factor EnvC (AmiA/AmiB activator)
MSLSIAENFLRNAREQHSQTDINSSLLKALAELTRDVKRLDEEMRRVRRDVQMARRF